ncbi:MAG: C40 family peptidase [Bacteroidales bacterium]|nr:C40 family peptidase [Bacteroidales bacterium]
MQKGICKLSVVPIRRIPSDKSEMVSQLLYGETFTITDTIENWALIRNDFDGYEGWIDIKQYQPISESETVTDDQLVTRICTAPISGLATTAGEMMHLSFGSILRTSSKDNTSIPGLEFWNNNDFKVIPEADKSGLIESARLFINVPYIWGGKSIFGVDCSGFVQLVYKSSGFQLPRDASQQFEQGNLISFIEESEPTDLAFFDNDEGQIVHVGILLGQSQIIHASGKVRIDSIDHYGIFNHEQHRYTHRLRIIKRL